MTSLWRYCKDQYDRVLRIAGTMLAERLMWLFAVLESIIIPIPVDPLLIATVLARPKNWIKLVAACTIASVIGGGLGWVIGVWLNVGVEQLLFYLPHAVATPENTHPEPLGIRRRDVRAARTSWTRSAQARGCRGCRSGCESKDAALQPAH